MKKIFAIFLILSFLFVVFISCSNDKDTTTTTDVKITSEITTITTIASQTTQAITTIPPLSTEQAITTMPMLYTEYTIGTLEEPDEIQAKIDRNRYNKIIPSKVIITCGEERDVPYLVVGMAEYYQRFDSDWRGKVIFDGWVNIGGTGSIAYEAITLHGDELPVFHCSSMDELVVYVNDNKVDINRYNFIDENGNKVEYKGNGRYYVYCEVGCLGPDVMQNGEKYDSQGIHYAAVFIVEITE